MRAKAKMNRNERIRFVPDRFEFDVTEIAVKSHGCYCRHLPLATTLNCHLVREAAVLGDDV